MAGQLSEQVLADGPDPARSMAALHALCTIARLHHTAADPASGANQDGVPPSGELKTLAGLGIASINVIGQASTINTTPVVVDTLASRSGQVIDFNCKATRARSRVTAAKCNP